MVAAKKVKLKGPAVVTLYYDDDSNVEIDGVIDIVELPDSALEIWHGDDSYTKVRPTYRFYQISYGEEE